MPITVTTSRDVPADAAVLAVPVFAGPSVPAGIPVELDLAFLESRDFEGKVGQTQPLLADDGSTILAVGFGAPEDVDLDVFRRAGAAIVKGSWKAPSIAVAVIDSAPAGTDRGRAAQALAEGMVLGAHQFTEYKSKTKPAAVEAGTLVARPGGA